MGDWDSSIRLAVELEFPGVKIHECIFHCSQCLVKRAGEVGLTSEIRKPGEILSNFSAFTVLPLLPFGMIYPAFRKLRARALDLHVGFPKFIAYVESQWLQRIGLECLSVHGLSERTNNDVESNNSKFLRRTGPHGPVSSLVSIIADFVQDVVVEKAQHSKDIENILSEPRKSTKLNRIRIYTAWARLANKEISYVEFLDIVKYKVEKVNHRENLKND